MPQHNARSLIPVSHLGDHRRERLVARRSSLVARRSSLVAIGGGDVARDEMLAARRAGRQAVFIPADMNHQRARAKAKARGAAEPTDFRGSAHAALAHAPG